MKNANRSLITVAAPTALDLAALASIEGGVSQDEVIGQVGQQKWDYFEQNKPKDGQSRDSYAKQTEKKSDYERWDADRYWDYWAKQDGTKPGNVT
jgi:hypothetical protein